VQAYLLGGVFILIFVLCDGITVYMSVYHVILVQDEVAVVEGSGVVQGMRVVVEGGQNLRPGSAVAEAQSEAGKRERVSADK
jgi:hypothetical protein